MKRFSFLFFSRQKFNLNNCQSSENRTRHRGSGNLLQKRAFNTHTQLTNFDMTKIKSVFLSMMVTLAACNLPKENAKLKDQVDSLKLELQTNKNMASALEEVGSLIDSIDNNRHVLRTRMIEGASIEDYRNRMSEINQYVKSAEKKITELEKSLTRSKSSGNQYAQSLKKLKDDLEARNKEIATLQEQVKAFQDENSNLIQTVNLQKAEIEDKLAQIETKKQETERLQSEVKQLMVQSKLDESEAYYVKGTLLEETARRTKFAPRKKKETTQKALDMYELAALCGNDKAAAKVAELKKRI